LWETNLKNGIARTGFVLFFLIVTQCNCYAQRHDTISGQESPSDTLEIEHSPGKAALLSAALPGLGQIYNRKVWKVPIIYVGAGAIYYAYDFNAGYYDEYKSAFTSFVNGKIQEYNGITNQEVLKRAKNYYRRYRDLNLLLMAGLYLVQIIDATVDAYMLDFDVSEEITLKLQPSPIYIKNYPAFAGLKCSIHF